VAVLTISREFGSGGREIGFAVAERLGYLMVDKETILSKTVMHGKAWERWSRELDERSPSLWERYDWSFRGFVALVQSIMLDFALKDRAVLMGRGGNFLLRDIPYALRLRVRAPIDKRRERIMLRETVDMQTASWLMEKTDRERAGFIKSIYGHDWDDPSQYDLVIDTGKTSIEESVGLLVERLFEKDKLCEEACRRTVFLRREAARMKSSLLTNTALFLPTLEVEAQGGEVVVKAVVHNKKEREGLITEAKAVAEGLPLRFEIRYRG
jgi:hypothetical protein